MIVDSSYILLTMLVCYPPHGLGPSGVRAILSFFEDEDDSGKV